MQSRSTHATAGVQAFGVSTDDKAHCFVLRLHILHDHTGTPECVPMTNDHTRNAGVQTVERYCKVTHKQSTLQSYVSEFVPSLCKRHVQRLESVPMTKRLFVSFVFTSYMMTGGAECVPWCNVWSSGSVRVDTMTTPGTLECKPSKDIAK